MELQFDESFEKSIRKLKDKKTREKLATLIENFEAANNLSEVSNVKKMRGFQSYYRVRIGDYRVGFELLEDESVLFILVAHRKDIYNYFP